MAARRDRNLSCDVPRAIHHHDGQVIEKRRVTHEGLDGCKNGVNDVSR